MLQEAKVKKQSRRAPRPNTSAGDPAPKRRATPTGGRAQQTYLNLLKAAGELLGEVGFERLSTNDICERANVTPPALYHYFNDKYDILEELAHRLLRRQNEAFFIWLFNGGATGSHEQRKASLSEWYRIAAEVTASEPGALSVLRALRALPHLTHIRLESQRMLTDRMCDFYHRLYPEMDRQLLWYRLRISCEFGFMVDELALEEERIPNEILFEEVAEIVGIPLFSMYDASARACGDGDAGVEDQPPAL